MPKNKKPKLIKTSKNKKQSGEITSLEADISRIAMLPGQRMSKTGKLYWETRKNRSDKDRVKRI